MLNGQVKGAPKKIFGTERGDDVTGEKRDEAHEICVDNMRILKAFKYKDPLKGCDRLSWYMLDKNWKNVAEPIPETFEAIMAILRLVKIYMGRTNEAVTTMQEQNEKRFK